MKRIVLIILLLTPLIATAQRMEVYTYNSFKYLSVYAYGLPRDVVKTNSEMKASQWNGDGTGVTKRHHTTKGFDERIGNDGYNANQKISFAFIAAPYNVDVRGEHVTESTEEEDKTMTWAEASGWDETLNTGAGESYAETGDGVGVGLSTLADAPSGCAAYKGMHGTDKAGDWRLPTQREMQVMFTVIDQAFQYIVSNEVVQEINEGSYWTSTEFFSADAPGQAWSISSITGFPSYDPKSDKKMVRCVKDIYETINE